MAQLVSMIIFSVLLITISDILPILSHDVDDHPYVYYQKSDLEDTTKNYSKNNSTWNKTTKSLYFAIKNGDYREILNIFRNNLFHRTTIADVYYINYQSQLKVDILRSKKLDGYFKHLMAALSTPDLDFLVEEVHNAIEPYSEKNKNIFLDIFCRRNYMEIDRLNNLYALNYEKELSEDLLNIPSGEFRNSLIDFARGVMKISEFSSLGFGSGKQSPSIYPRDPLPLCTEGVYDYYAKRLGESFRLRDYKSITRLLVITLNENTLHHIIERFNELFHSRIEDEIINYTSRRSYRESLILLVHAVKRLKFLFK